MEMIKLYLTLLLLTFSVCERVQSHRLHMGDTGDKKRNYIDIVTESFSYFGAGGSMFATSLRYRGQEVTKVGVDAGEGEHGYEVTLAFFHGSKKIDEATQYGKNSGYAAFLRIFSDIPNQQQEWPFPIQEPWQPDFGKAGLRIKIKEIEIPYNG
jgi:hypothetical protein